MTLGLDLSNGHARAVVVDECAKVVGRGEQELGPGARREAATAALQHALAGASGPVSRAAVVVPYSGAAAPAGIEQVCRNLLPEAPAPTVIASGMATVVAEHWCGAARGLTTVVALTAGEHVTSGVMLEGKVWSGAHGLAGAVGWLSLNPVEREDYRRLGGLEADASSAGIVRRFVWRIKSGDKSAAAPSGDLSHIKVDDVFQGARMGDGVCVSVIRDTAKYVGMAVSNLAAILDPEAIVLGGLLASWADLLAEPIRVECSRRLSQAQAEGLQIVPSTLGHDAAAIGAARLAHLAA